MAKRRGEEKQELCLYALNCIVTSVYVYMYTHPCAYIYTCVRAFIDAEGQLHVLLLRDHSPYFFESSLSEPGVC